MRHIGSFPDVRIDTGNVHRHVDVLGRINADPVEELLSSLDYQLCCAGKPNVTYSSDMVILAPGAGYTFSDENELCNLKVTLKIFMTNWNYRQISDCVDTALSRLGVKTIKQLIITFPNDNDDEDGFWLNNALTLWKNIEDLVYSGKVISLGVADLGFSRVKMLNEAVVRVRPSIYHYNVGDCCELSQELRNYAAEHNIYLLTHNDPNLSKLKGKVGEKIRSFLGDDQLFELGWFARYTVWDQSRSIVRSKGYILQFQKNH